MLALLSDWLFWVWVLIAAIEVTYASLAMKAMRGYSDIGDVFYFILTCGLGAGFVGLVCGGFVWFFLSLFIREASYWFCASAVYVVAGISYVVSNLDSFDKHRQRVAWNQEFDRQQQEQQRESVRCKSCRGENALVLVRREIVRQQDVPETVVRQANTYRPAANPTLGRYNPWLGAIDYRETVDEYSSTVYHDQITVRYTEFLLTYQCKYCKAQVAFEHQERLEL